MLGCVQVCYTASSSSSHSHCLCCFSLAACTMPSCHLFLFLLLLLPGMRADPEEPLFLQLLHTSVFTISSLDISMVTLLEDVAVLALDPGNWSIHFHWPWASQATAEGDAEKIKSHLKFFLHSFIQYVHKTAQQAQLDYPFVIQIRAGCVLHPNKTRRGFMDVGEGGRDLIAFNMERQHWETQRLSPLAELTSYSLNSKKAITVLLVHLLSIFCPSYMLTLCNYGRADLERQEPPLATVFARTPSPAQLLLVCRVTGFYPRSISVAWLRDGQEVPAGPALNTSAILPNADLTYQLRSILAVLPHDGYSYACRVRHRSLGTRSLLIPWENLGTAPTISIVITVLLLVAIAFGGVVWWWKCRKGAEVTWETQEFTI